MTTTTSRAHIHVITAVAVMILLSPASVRPHCDTMNGPVVTAAKQALSTGDVNLVLIWVRSSDEAAIRDLFRKTLDVRKTSPDARALADMYFFETLVRLHRAGEGMPYTGLKPADTVVEPGIQAADEALESGSAERLLQELDTAVHRTLKARHAEVLERRRFPSGAVDAGREYVKSYVEFVHYVERLYEAATTPAEGHAEEAQPPPGGHH